MISRLPKVFFHNCILNLDDKSIILIAGGVDSNWYSKETYIYNTFTDAWTTGPSLVNGRYAHGCEKIPESSQSIREVIIAVGGNGSSQTVEILDGINNTWKMGISCFTLFIRGGYNNVKNVIIEQCCKCPNKKSVANSKELKIQKVLI